MVAENKERQEWDGQEVEGGEGEDHHAQEVGSDGQFQIRQPAAAGAVLFVFELHRALADGEFRGAHKPGLDAEEGLQHRSEEHTSELQSLRHLVCRLLLEKKKKKHT